MPPPQKTALITGCSAGGLGDALARELHARGCRVFATARSLSKTTDLKETLNIETLPLDVLSDDSIRACVATVSTLTNGSLDILINNAGGGYMLPIADVELSECRKLFDLNVFSVIAVTQAFLPLLIKAKGLVVLQSSVGSVIPSPGLAIYDSSKAAIGMIADTLRVEMAPFDVRVTELKTGSVQSNFHENSKITLPKTSLYAPIRSELEPFLNGATEQDRKREVERDAWARTVVALLLKSKPPAQVWKGGAAWIAWFITTFLPHTFIDGILSSMTGLDKLRSLVRASDRENK